MSRQVDRRPLLVALIALIIGLTAPTYPLNLLLLLPFLALGRSLRSWALAAAFVTIGAWVSPPSLPVLASPRYVEAAMRVTSLPTYSGGLETAEGDIDGLHVRMLLEGPPMVHYGDVWYATGTIVPVDESFQTAAQELGLQGTLQPRRMVLESEGPAWIAAICQWSSAFQRFAMANAPDPEARWVAALWFHDAGVQRSQNADSSKKVPERPDGFTLVAASGLQVYVLAGIVMGLLMLLRLPRPWQSALTILVLAAFCIAKGLSPSTFRACVGCALFLLASSIGREPDSLSALSLAGVIFLLFWPRALIGIGFQMSFAVVAALCLFPPFRRESRESLGSQLKGSARQLATACLIMFMAGTPLLVAHVGAIGVGLLPQLALFGIVPPVVLTLSMLAFVVSGILPLLAKGLMTLAVVPLTAYLQTVQDWLTHRLPVASVPDFSAYWLVLYYGLWLCVWRERPWRADIRG